MSPPLAIYASGILVALVLVWNYILDQAALRRRGFTGLAYGVPFLAALVAAVLWPAIVPALAMNAVSLAFREGVRRCR